MPATGVIGDGAAAGGARRIARRLRDAVARSPALYLPFKRWLFRGHSEIVDRRTDVVIDGFPRSGNSYLEAAFRMAQPGPAHVAHHVHAPAQILRAARLRVPTIVLFREPRATCASLLLEWDALYSPGEALVAYGDYYAAVLRVRERITLVSFECATRHPERAIAALNERSGRNFSLPPAGESGGAQIVSFMDTLLRARKHEPHQIYSPAAGSRSHRERAQRKAALRRALEHERHRAALDRALAIHARLGAAADC